VVQPSKLVSTNWAHLVDQPVYFLMGVNLENCERILQMNAAFAVLL
jgi:hypothetical protein